MAIADYDYFVAHSNMMTELMVLRGLLKRKLPIVKNGTYKRLVFLLTTDPVHTGNR